MTTHEACKMIEEVSEKLCLDHYAMRSGDGWYTGGPSHNDDRLAARLVGDSIEVTDGNAVETYDGSREEDAIRAYVTDWLADLWADA